MDIYGIRTGIEATLITHYDYAYYLKVSLIEIEAQSLSAPNESEIIDLVISELNLRIKELEKIKDKNERNSLKD